MRPGAPPKVPETQAGVELFLRDYYATVNWGMRTGHSKEIRAYLMSSCHCAQLADFVDEIRGDGEHLDGPGNVVERIGTAAIGDNNAVVTITYTSKHLRLVDADGKFIESTTDNFVHAHETYTLIYEGDSWRIYAVRQG